MGAVDQRQPLAIDLFEAAHDVGRDLLRRVGNAELVALHARRARRFRPASGDLARRRACSATTRWSSCPSSRSAPDRATGRLAPSPTPRAPRPTPARCPARLRRGRKRPPRSRVDVALVDVDERPLSRALLDGEHLADEEGVLAGRDFGSDATSQPADCSGHKRRALALAHVDALPDRDRRHAAREVLRHGLLAGGEKAGAERPGAAQQLVQSRPAPDGEADQRRLERERYQRADRQAQALTFEVDADDCDSRRESPHQLAKLIAAYHGGEPILLVLPTELVAVEDRVELRVHRTLE